MAEKNGNGKKKIKYKIELVTERNDRWLNSHIRPIIESWRANIDFQLILDAGKVVDYMTKYVTKVETAMTKGIAAMIRNILRTTIEDGMSV